MFPLPTTSTQGIFGPRGLPGPKGDPGELVSHMTAAAGGSLFAEIRVTPGYMWQCLWWWAWSCMSHSPPTGSRRFTRTTCTSWEERQQGGRETCSTGFKLLPHLTTPEGPLSSTLTYIVNFAHPFSHCHPQGPRGQKGIRGPRGVIGRTVSGMACSGAEPSHC